MNYYITAEDYRELQKTNADLLAMLERVTADAANAYRAIAFVDEGIIPTANLVTLAQARALIAQIKGRTVYHWIQTGTAPEWALKLRIK